MGNVETVAAFLQNQQGRWFCDRCIAKLADIKPLNQVNVITRSLGRTSEFERRPAVWCSRGHHLRICTRARLSSRQNT